MAQRNLWMTFHTRPWALVNSLLCPPWMCGFSRDQWKQFAIHCATDLKWDFTRPNNLVHKPCILYHIPLKLVTKLHVLIRIIFIHGMLQLSRVRLPPTSFQNAVYTCPANSCLVRTSSYGFSGDRKKCCNTTSKEAGLVSLYGFPDHFLCTLCCIISDSKLSQTRLTVTRVASFCCQFTPTEPLDFAHILKFRVSLQNYPALLERQALWRRFVLLTKSRTALLVFMPLALSFQWKPHYIKFVLFWFHNENVRRYILLKYVYIFWQIL